MGGGDGMGGGGMDHGKMDHGGMDHGMHMNDTDTDRSCSGMMMVRTSNSDPTYLLPLAAQINCRLLNFSSASISKVLQNC